MAANNLYYLAAAEIDKTKWDRCIDGAANGLIYGYSFYLDSMAAHWDGLVWSPGTPADHEYLAVMPLTWNKKYGIYYLYQPFLTAQLGVFGNNIPESILAEFIKAIPNRFKLIEIALNSRHNEHLPPSAVLRKNYLLKLDRPYTDIYAGYRDQLKRNLRKAAETGCTFQKEVSVEKVIELALPQLRKYDSKVDENIARFRRLYSILEKEKMAIAYGISREEQLLASCVFFFSHRRAYYILVGNHPDGKTYGASHALLDNFIKEQAGRDLLLDFEGSDIESLAFFYSSFGAVEATYPQLAINRLPFLLRWAK